MRRKAGLGAPGNRCQVGRKLSRHRPSDPGTGSVVLRADCKHLLPAPPSDFILVARHWAQWEY